METIAEQLRGVDRRSRAIYYVHNGTHYLPATSEQTGEIWEVRLAQEDALYESLQARAEDTQVNIPRMRHFLGALGLTPPPLVCLQPHIAEAMQIASNPQPGAFGVYSPTFRIATLFVPNTRNARATAMHELAHGTGLQSMKVPPGPFVAAESAIQRSDFGRIAWKKGRSPRRFGQFLNEGRAELVAGGYRERYAVTDPAPWHARGMAIPGKYMFEETKGFGKPRTPMLAGATAANAFELLVARDPAILEHLLAGSQTLEAGSLLRKRIDALSPGMYGYLEKLAYTRTDFYAGLSAIVDTFYRGDMRVAGRVGQDITRSVLAEKIAAHNLATGISFTPDTPSLEQRVVRASRFALSAMRARVALPASASIRK